MTDDGPTRLTPQQARARFGDLLDYRGVHKHFGDPSGGDWRPRLGPGMTLEEYRLFRQQSGGTKWRPRGKR